MPLRATNPSIYNQLKSDNWDALSYSVNGTRVLTESQPTINNPAGGSTIDIQLRAGINAVLNILGLHGLMGGSGPTPLNAVIDGGILVLDGGIQVIDS
jgi:hypothetical protein